MKTAIKLALFLAALAIPQVVHAQGRIIMAGKDGSNANRDMTAICEGNTCSLACSGPAAEGEVPSGNPLQNGCVGADGKMKPMSCDPSGAVKVAPPTVEGDAVAATTGVHVIAGKGPDGKAKAFSLSSTGDLHLTDKTCTSVAQSILSIGNGAAVTVPAASLAGRRYIRICVSSENVGSPYIKCLLGGNAPIIGIANPGDVIVTGECLPYTAASTDTIKCIGSAAGVGVTTFECS